MNDDRYQRSVESTYHATGADFVLRRSRSRTRRNQPQWMEEACRLQQKLWQHANYVICRNL